MASSAKTFIALSLVIMMIVLRPDFTTRERRSQLLFRNRPPDALNVATAVHSDGVPAARAQRESNLAHKRHGHRPGMQQSLFPDFHHGDLTSRGQVLPHGLFTYHPSRQPFLIARP